MNRKVLEKVQTLDGKKDKVFCKVTLEHEIELDLKEQEVNKVKKKVPSEVVSEGKEKVIRHKVGKKKPVRELSEQVLVKETLEVEVKARSNICSLRQASSLAYPLPSSSPKNPSGGPGRPAVRPQQ